MPDSQVLTDLSVILGGTVGALLRAGMPAEEITEQVRLALIVSASIAAKPEMMDGFGDLLTTTVMDALATEEP